MSRQKTLIVLLKKEFIELVRTSRLWIMGALFLFFGMMAPVAARYVKEIVAAAADASFTPLIPDPTYLDVPAQFVKNTSQIITIVLIFIFMGIMAREKTQQTAVFVLVKPVSRSRFFLAKLVTLWLSVTACNLLSAFLCYLYSLIFFNQMPGLPFLSMTALLSIFLLFLVTMILFFSTLFPSSAPAAGVTFLTWIGLNVLTIPEKIGKFSPLYLINLSQSQFTAIEWPWQPLAGTGILILGMIIGGIMVFRKWEP